MLVHAYNSSIQEAQMGGLLKFEAHPEPHITRPAGDTPSQNKGIKRILHMAGVLVQVCNRAQQEDGKLKASLVYRVRLSKAKRV